MTRRTAQREVVVVALVAILLTACAAPVPGMPVVAARIDIPVGEAAPATVPVAPPPTAEPLPPWTSSAAAAKTGIGPRFVDTGRSTGAIAARPGPVALGGRLALVTAAAAATPGMFWLTGPTGGDAHVLVVDAASGTPMPVQPPAPFAGPGWPSTSADGRWVAYATPGELGARVVLWDAEAGSVVPLPGLERQTGRDPAVDASGRHLVFVTGPEAAPRLVHYDRGAALVVDVPVPEALRAGLRTPSLSGDARVVSFVAGSARGDANVVVLDLPGNRPIAAALVNSADQERDPALDATGRRLLFSSDRSGSFDIYGYDLDTDRYMDLGGIATWADETLPRFCGDAAIALVSNVEGAPVAYVRALSGLAGTDR